MSRAPVGELGADPNSLRFVRGLGGGGGFVVLVVVVVGTTVVVSLGGSWIRASSVEQLTTTKMMANEATSQRRIFVEFVIIEL